MKTLEAIIALLVFLMIVQMFQPTARQIDNSLHRMQIANDVWRVFQLRGDLEGFDKVRLNADAEKITGLTSLCIGFDEEDVTSCIAGNTVTQVKKVAIINGEPKEITMRIGIE
jgi:hypothetical protein